MESLSFSFFRIPKAFLVRFFNPEMEKKKRRKEELGEMTFWKLERGVCVGGWVTGNVLCIIE